MNSVSILGAAFVREIKSGPSSSNEEVCCCQVSDLRRVRPFGFCGKRLTRPSAHFLHTPLKFGVNSRYHQQGMICVVCAGQKGSDFAVGSYC